MKKSNAELTEILLKNVINMHEKLNILIDYFVKDLDKYEEDEEREFFKGEEQLVEIDKKTYKEMCKILESSKIPFMGIA
jgi:hypothetical protein|tara:strand:- start:841 stop:1077 length:237 start_codon:yes stop_codon:yes gene_type:complete